MAFLGGLFNRFKSKPTEPQPVAQQVGETARAGIQQVGNVAGMYSPMMYAPIMQEHHKTLKHIMMAILLVFVIIFIIYLYRKHEGKGGIIRQGLGAIF